MSISSGYSTHITSSVSGTLFSWSDNNLPAPNLNTLEFTVRKPVAGSDYFFIQEMISSDIIGDENSVIDIEGTFTVLDVFPLNFASSCTIRSTGSLLFSYYGMKILKNVETDGTMHVDGLLEFDSSSTLILNGGIVKSNDVIVHEFASIIGNGLINSNVVNLGTIIPSGVLKIQNDLVIAQNSNVSSTYNNNTQLIVNGILSVNGLFVFTFPNSIPSNYTISLVLFGSLLSEHDSFKVQCDHVVTTQDYPGIDPVSGQCLLPLDPNVYLVVPLNNSNDIIWSRNDIWVPSPPNENSTVIIDGNYINQVVFIDQNVIINSLYLTNVVLSLDCCSITVNGFTSFIDSSIESTCDIRSEFTSFTYELIGVTKMSGINLIVLEFGKLIEPQLILVNSKVIVIEDARLIVDQSDIIQSNISGNEHSDFQIEGTFETRHTLPLVLDTHVSISSTGTLLAFFNGLKVGKSMENSGVISVSGLLEFDSPSTLILNGGSVKAKNVTVQELASITGFGLINSTVVNYGKIIPSGLLEIQKDFVIAEHSSVLLNYNNNETQLIVDGILSVNGSFVFTFPNSIPSNYTFSLVLFGSLLSEHDSFKVQCDHVVTTQDYPGPVNVSGQCPSPVDNPFYFVVPLNNSNDILWSRNDIWVPSPPNENSTVIIDGNYINQVVFIELTVVINTLYLTNVVLSLDCSSITVNGFTSFIDSSIESTCDIRSEFTSFTYELIGVTKMSGINLIVLEFGKLIEPQLILVNSKVIVTEDATLIVDQSDIIQSNISGNGHSVIQIEGLFETRDTLPLVLDTDVSISSTGTLLSLFNGLKVGKSMENSGVISVDGLLEFDSSSTLILNGGSVKAENVIVQESTSITGYGLINSTVFNYGTIIPSGELEIQNDLVVAQHSNVLLSYNNNTQLIVNGILSLNGSFVFAFPNSIPSNYTISLVLFGSLLSEHDSFKVQCQCPSPVVNPFYLVVPLNNSNDILWSRNDIWVPSPPNENSTVIIDGNYINQVVFIDQNVIINSLYLTNVVLSLDCSSITVNSFTSFIDSSIESTCDIRSEFTAFTYELIRVTKMSGINLIILEFGKLIEPQLILVNSKVIVTEDATLIVDQSDITQSNISGNGHSVIQIEGLFETRDTLPLVLDTDVSISSTGTLLSLFNGLKVGKSMESSGVISVDGLLEFDSSSTLILNGGSVKAKNVIVQESTSITGFGLINSTVVNYGTIIPSGVLEIHKDLVVAQHSNVLLTYNNNTQLIVKGILSVNGSFVFTFPNSIPSNYSISLVIFGSVLSEHDSFKVQCDQYFDLFLDDSSISVVTTLDYPGIDPVSGQCPLPLDTNVYLVVPLNNSNDILWSRNDIWVPSPPNENSTVIIDGNYINQVVFIDQNVIINSLYLTNVVLSLDCSAITVNGFTSFIESSIESSCDTRSEFTSLTYEFIGVTKLSGINLIVLEFGKLIEPQLILFNSKIIVKEDARLIVDQSDIIQSNISGNGHSAIQIKGLFETRDTLPLVLDTDVSISSTGTLLAFFSGLKVGKSMESSGVISVNGLLEFDSSSTLILNGGSVKVKNVIVQELASITGFGLINSTVLNYGTIKPSGLLEIQKDFVIAEHSSVLLNYNNNNTQLIVNGILSVNGSFVFAFHNSILSNFTFSLVLFGSLYSEHDSFKVQCDNVVTTQDYPGIDPVSGQCLLPVVNPTNLDLPPNNTRDIRWSRNDIWVPSPPNENSAIIIDGKNINQVVFIDQNVNINSLSLTNVVISLDCSTITVNGFTSFIDSSFESTCDIPSEFTSLSYEIIGVTKLSGINLNVLEFGK
ncbi:hypothetical protein GEMRC1_007518 [Eukaryota sp. GEM-RC1]